MQVLGQRAGVQFAPNARSTPPSSVESARCTDMTQGSRAFLTVGLPLFVLTVSGFYGLSHLVQGKYDVQVGARLMQKRL